MKLNIRVTGSGNLEAALVKRRKKITKAVARGTTRAALLLQKSAREKILRGPKSGRKYGSHQASSPGEAPANWTGNLQRNIRVVAARPGDVVEAKVIAGTQYAKALHYGTRRAGKNRSVTIEPRPFMNVSDELSKEMDRVIKEEMDKE